MLQLSCIRAAVFAKRAYGFILGVHPTFNPYAHLALLKPIKCTAVAVDYDVTSVAMPFSLITTIKNESTNIVRFLKSIESQSLQPNEIIIVDGGSDDSTLALANEYLAKVHLPASIFQYQNINIAKGRNIALAECSHEIVVMTDA